MNCLVYCVEGGSISAQLEFSHINGPTRVLACKNPTSIQQ